MNVLTFSLLNQWPLFLCYYTQREIDVYLHLFL